MAGLTMKSTKEAIFKALQEAQAELASLRIQKYDPVADAAEAKKVSVLANASETLGSGFQQRMTDVEREITSLIRQVSSLGTQRLEEYQNLEQAISILEKRLEDLTGIEAAVLDLVSVVNAKNDLIKELDSQLLSVRNEIANARQEWNAELVAAQAKARKDREIAEQEWSEEFERRKRRETADFEERLEDCAREHRLWIKETSESLLLREKEVQDAEEELAQLRKDANMKEFYIKSAREEGFKEGREQAEKEASNQAEIERIKHEAEVNNLKSEIVYLLKDLADKDSLIQDLQKKLDEAYGRIENMAVKQSEAARPNVITSHPSSR